LVKIGEYSYYPLHLVVYELDFPATGLLLKNGAILADPRSLKTETVWQSLEIKDDEEEYIDDQLIRFFLLHTSEWTKTDVQFWITTVLRSKRFANKKPETETDVQKAERLQFEAVKTKVYQHFSEVKGRNLFPITDKGLETIVGDSSPLSLLLIQVLKEQLREFRIGGRSQIGFPEFWSIWDAKYPPHVKKSQKTKQSTQEIF